MKVIGFCGASGVGKTTLIEQLITELKSRGQRVSVIKHAHKRFDIDHPGKDSWRHRQAGAFEVMIASGQRLAKLLIGAPASIASRKTSTPHSRASCISKACDASSIWFLDKSAKICGAD